MQQTQRMFVFRKGLFSKGTYLDYFLLCRSQRQRTQPARSAVIPKGFSESADATRRAMLSAFSQSIRILVEASESKTNQTNF